MSAWMCFHLPSQTAEHNDFNPDMSAITTIGFFWRVTLNSTFSPLIGFLHTGPCLVFGGKIKMDGYKSEQKKNIIFLSSSVPKFFRRHSSCRLYLCANLHSETLSDLQ